MQVEIAGKTMEISNADKIFYPDADITKGETAEYYAGIAKTMLPHIQGRPANLQRFPDGIEDSGFFQQSVPDYFPDSIRRVEVEKREGGTVEHVVPENPEDLVYLADQGTITLHIWQSRADAPEMPDRVTFDLDPVKGDFSTAKFAAEVLGDMLKQTGLTPYVMTTGSKGLHVVAPLEPEQDFDAVREFARRAAELAAAREPDRLTVEQRKEKRKGRVFLDYLRNSYGQTVVAPYSLRPLPGAPLAAPLDWDELRRSDLRADAYTLKNIFRRLGKKQDPMAGFGKNAGSLASAREALQEMESDAEG